MHETCFETFVEEMWGSALSDTELYYKATVTNNLILVQKQTKDQRN